MMNELQHLEKLNDEEIAFIPTLKKILLKTNKNKTIYSKDLVRGINLRREQFCLTKPFTEARLRKMINYFRCTATLPVISSSNGYYVSYDDEELLFIIQSLRQRAQAIIAASDGLDYIRKQKEIIDYEIDEFGFTWRK